MGWTYHALEVKIKVENKAAHFSQFPESFCSSGSGGHATSPGLAGGTELVGWGLPCLIVASLVCWVYHIYSQGLSPKSMVVGNKKLYIPLPSQFGICNKWTRSEPVSFGFTRAHVTLALTLMMESYTLVDQNWNRTWYTFNLSAVDGRTWLENVGHGRKSRLGTV